MEAETTNNINNFSYIFWILGGIAIPCIITLTAKSIKKHTFKNILTEAFLLSSFITLSNNLYKINHYTYHFTDHKSIYNKIAVSILCIFICLVLIYVIYEKPKDDKFMGTVHSITYYLNYLELALQKSIQSKDHLKNALQSRLISQSEYAEKVTQIDTRIENEQKMIDRVKDHQAKVETLKSFEQKKQDLINLYTNSVLTQKECHAKVEELGKEKMNCINEINDEFEFIKKMIEEHHKKF